MPLNCSTFVTQKEQLKCQAARGVTVRLDAVTKEFVTLIDEATTVVKTAAKNSETKLK
ncbi:MAG TPA: hypothetical protein VKZ45_08785 [Vicingaceae bacterium]|nr:hypothetical protein [Vicingaceae bacterium]